MAAYPFAPWIQPPESIAGRYLQGVQIGNQIANQRAQLAEAQNRSALQASLQQQELQQQALAQQQRLEVQKAYNQQAIALRQQQLQDAEQLNLIRVQQAARALTLRQRYTQRVAQGEAPAKVLLEMGPELGIGEQAMAAAFRSLTPKTVPTPPQVITQDGQKFWQITEPSGAVRIQAFPQTKTTTPKMSEFDKAEMQTDLAALKAIQNQIGQASPNVAPKFIKGLQDRADQLREKLEEKWGNKLPPVQEVIRIDQHGRKVVFDAKTKKALRYADEQPADMGGDSGSDSDESDDES